MKEKNKVIPELQCRDLITKLKISIHLNFNKMKKKPGLKFTGVVFPALAVLFLVSSCANREFVENCLTGHTYGFLGGLWHGIIAPIDFIAMLFRDDVSLYAQNNNGAWYAFGFLIGSGGWGFLGGKGIARKRSRQKPE